MFKVLLDAKTGKLSDEEIKKFRKSLLDIEKKGTVWFEFDIKNGLENNFQIVREIIDLFKISLY